jgi:malonyl-CoA decarboxylase
MEPDHSKIDKPRRTERPLMARSVLNRLFASRSSTARTAVSHEQADRAIALGHALISERGEVAGARRATELLALYQSLDDVALERFFDKLVAEFSPEPRKVAAAARNYTEAPSAATLRAIQEASEPPRQELFRRFNIATGGTRALVEMRRRVRRDLGTHPHWEPLDEDLLHLFRSWFNRGFLNLQRIDWRTSALVLERLIEYEAVHQINGWSDLRRRLEADRRCFAFFHPALPEEPLIFIEVALTRELSATVQPLIDPRSPVADPSSASHAIFYSITNCQEGLRGVSFGHFLIKQVAEDLGREFPRLRKFATLSPMPGFRRWLLTTAPTLVNGKRGAELAELVERLGAEPRATLPVEHQQTLMTLAAYYLLQAKKGTKPLDPVARFHLANGARLERLNWGADISASGLSNAFGLMVNYVYGLSELERNHEAYAQQAKVVASRDIEKLSMQALLSDRRRNHE